MSMLDKATTTLHGTVEKVIPSLHPAVPEKVQIEIEGADDLYKEIRIENELNDENGHPVKLDVGANVVITVETEPDAIVSKK